MHHVWSCCDIGILKEKTSPSDLLHHTLAKILSLVYPNPSTKIQIIHNSNKDYLLMYSLKIRWCTWHPSFRPWRWSWTRVRFRYPTLSWTHGTSGIITPPARFTCTHAAWNRFFLLNQSLLNLADRMVHNSNDSLWYNRCMSCNLHSSFSHHHFLLSITYWRKYLSTQRAFNFHMPFRFQR